MAGAAALVVLLALRLPDIALAHEKRVIGKYTFVVGFLNEPSLQGQPNGLDLTIADASGNPVDGAESTLKVAIGFGEALRGSSRSGPDSDSRASTPLM